MTTQTLGSIALDANSSGPRPLVVPRISPTDTTAAGMSLDLRGVSKAYAGRTVLDKVDLQVRPGEFVAIIGRSGCGKSTLLKLVAGLEQADAGTVARGGDASDLRLMFQDARLLPWKRVVDNVALGLKAGDALRWAREVLSWVGLADRAQEWPANLSGGQRQRVALARALAHRPRLLLLDEPLGALDALTRIEMQRLIESLWRRQRFTAVMVTHDVPEAVAMADRLVLVEDGRIALDERVALERPRLRGCAPFGEVEQRILDRLLGEPPAPGPADGLDFGVPAHPLRFAD